MHRFGTYLKKVLGILETYLLKGKRSAKVKQSASTKRPVQKTGLFVF